MRHGLRELAQKREKVRLWLTEGQDRPDLQHRGVDGEVGGSARVKLAVRVAGVLLREKFPCVRG